MNILIDLVYLKLESEAELTRDYINNFNERFNVDDYYVEKDGESFFVYFYGSFKFSFKELLEEKYRAGVIELHNNLHKKYNHDSNNKDFQEEVDQMWKKIENDEVEEICSENMVDVFMYAVQGSNLYNFLNDEIIVMYVNGMEISEILVKDIDGIDCAINVIPEITVERIDFDKNTLFEDVVNYG